MIHLDDYTIEIVEDKIVVISKTVIAELRYDFMTFIYVLMLKLL